MTTRTVYEWPTPWPDRLIGWLLTAVAVMVVAAILAVCATGGYYELTRTKDSEVEGMIEAELPERATTDQISRFFEAHGIANGSIRPSAAEDRKLLEAGVPLGTMTISGMVRNDGYAIQLRDVMVWFILDANGLLESHLVYEAVR